MKQSRCSDSQILAVLKQAESAVPVPELCREHGVSSASFYKGRAKYRGISIRLAYETFGISLDLLPLSATAR